MAFLIPPVRGNQLESNSVSALANDALTSPRRMSPVFIDNCDEAVTRLVTAGGSVCLSRGSARESRLAPSGSEFSRKNREGKRDGGCEGMRSIHD